jgi:protein disulfide-isomerase A1
MYLNARIAAFVRRSTLPPVSIVDKTNITSFKSIDDAVFVAYLPPKARDLESHFTTLASRNHHRFVFGIASDEGVAKLENIHTPSIVCYKPEDGAQEVLTDINGIKTLEIFIQTATEPLVGELTRRNELKYLKVDRLASLNFEKYLTLLCRVENP